MPESENIFTDEEYQELVIAIISDGRTRTEEEIVAVINRLEEIVLADRLLDFVFEGELRPDLDGDELTWQARDGDEEDS